MCSCSSKSKISGMKKFSVKKAGEKAIPAAEIAAGFALAKIVPWLAKKILPNQNLTNTITGVAEIGVGLLVSTSSNKHLSNVGLGVAVSGCHTFLKGPIESAFKSAGLAGINQPNDYRPSGFRMGAPASVGCPRTTLN